jgi:hypothetical protein
MRDMEMKMGYYSDVGIVVVFECEEHADEVMDVYQTHPDVQKYDLAKEWRKAVLDDGTTVFYYSGYEVKWYHENEDVRAFLYMKQLIKNFGVERDFPWAWGLMRIGEDITDAEIDYEQRERCDVSNNLMMVIYEKLTLRRAICIYI